MKRNIVLFDGDCLLCNKSVQLIISKDSKKLFKFAAIQSPIGQKLLNTQGIDSSDLNTIYYIEDDHIFQESEAALHIAKQLDFPLKLMSVFLGLPKFLRDPFYKIISKTRYKVFGHSSSCWLPSKELKDRFIS